MAIAAGDYSPQVCGVVPISSVSSENMGNDSNGGRRPAKTRGARLRLPLFPRGGLESKPPSEDPLADQPAPLKVLETGMMQSVLASSRIQGASSCMQDDITRRRG